MRARSLRPVALVLALVCAGCVSPEDIASRVHDLRVLGMQAEPPEYVMTDPVLLGVLAKVIGRQQIPEQQVQFLNTQIPTVRMRALVIDPQGNGRPVHYRWTTCYYPESFRCEGTATEVVLGEGLVTNEEAAADFRLDFERVATIINIDSLKGLGGVPVQVTLRVWTDAQEMYATKRVVVTPPIKSLNLERLAELQRGGQPPDPAVLLAEFEKIKLPNKVANTNPPAPWPLLEGLLLVPGEAPEVKASPQPVFSAFPQRELQEEYVVPTFEGGVRTLQENWRYSWFSTLGYFRPQRTGGIDPNTLEEEQQEAKLNLLPDDPAGEFRVWTVVRDGRGGENWTERKLTFVPGGPAPSGR
ncbi:MAG: hypothetical protein ACK4N5_01075 [Myxococcales bacterium]